MLFRSARQWWTNSNRQLLLEAQRNLIQSVVSASPVGLVNTNTGSQTTSSSTLPSSPLNSLEFGDSKNHELPTVVLCHGFGSGLGFFYNNIDRLLSTNQVGRLLLVDWLGMGGSERPPCRRPVRGGQRDCHRQARRLPRPPRLLARRRRYRSVLVWRGATPG